MMRLSFIAVLALGSAALFVGQANAAEAVIGGKLAPSCYQIAETGGDAHHGIDLCSRALETDVLDSHDRSATYINLGVLQARAGDRQSALDSYNKAVTGDADIAEAYVDRSSTLIAMKDYSGALADAQKGISMGARFPEVALYNRAVAEEGLGDFTSAYRDLRQAVSLVPGFTQAKQELRHFKLVGDGTA